MPPDFLIIANPTSGTQQPPTLATRVCELLKARGAAAEVRVTQARGDATKIAADAASAGVKTIVGCGGDGTLQEIAQALDGGETAFGILPRGRCNDFAHALGLSKTDSPERLAKVLLDNQRRKIDLGKMGDKRFLTVATFGFDSEVSRFVETRKLWVKGTLAYFYGVMRILLSYKAPMVKLRGDFGTREGRLLLAATGNSPCYGGAMQIAPGAKLDDGKFQVCVVNEVPRLTVMRILPRVLKGTHIQHPAVSLLETKSLEIETPEGPQWVCADGESLGQTPCKFEIKPKALNVVAPKS